MEETEVPRSNLTVNDRMDELMSWCDALQVTPSHFLQMSHDELKLRLKNFKRHLKLKVAKNLIEYQRQKLNEMERRREKMEEYFLPRTKAGGQNEGAYGDRLLNSGGCEPNQYFYNPDDVITEYLALTNFDMAPPGIYLGPHRTKRIYTWSRDYDDSWNEGFVVHGIDAPACPPATPPNCRYEFRPHVALISTPKLWSHTSIGPCAGESHLAPSPEASKRGLENAEASRLPCPENQADNARSSTPEERPVSQIGSRKSGPRNLAVVPGNQAYSSNQLPVNISNERSLLCPENQVDNAWFNTPEERPVSQIGSRRSGPRNFAVVPGNQTYSSNQLPLNISNGRSSPHSSRRSASCSGPSISPNMSFSTSAPSTSFNATSFTMPGSTPRCSLGSSPSCPSSAGHPCRNRIRAKGYVCFKGGIKAEATFRPNS